MKLDTSFIHELDINRYFELIDYEPYSPYQRAFHDARNHYRFRSWFAGARGGKSHAGAHEMSYELLLPNRQLWIVAPTYELGEKEFRYVWEDLVEKFPRAGYDFRPYMSVMNYNIDRGKMEICIETGAWKSWLRVKSCEHLPSLLGEELDGLLLAEGAKMPSVAWSRYLSYRITSRRGFVIVPTTPDGMNWVHDKFFIKSGGPWQLGYESEGCCGLGDYWTQVSPANASPYYPKEEYERHREEDSEDDFNEQVLGRFVRRQGLVLREIVKPRNRVTWAFCQEKWGWTHTAPLEWPRAVGFDYGRKLAATASVVVPDWSGIVTFKEYFEYGVVEDVIRWALDIPGVNREGTRLIADRSAPLPEYNEALARLNAHASLGVEPSKSDPGKKKVNFETVNRVAKRGQLYIIDEPDGCLGLCREIERFVWKDPTQDDDREQVKKKDDHRIDSMVYHVIELALDLMVEEIRKKPAAHLPDKPEEWEAEFLKQMARVLGGEVPERTDVEEVQHALSGGLW